MADLCNLLAVLTFYLYGEDQETPRLFTRAGGAAPVSWRCWWPRMIPSAGANRHGEPCSPAGSANTP
jgi:hypothetical protein